MAKASLRLPNGTDVQIEGSVEEVRELLNFYGGPTPSVLNQLPRPATRPRIRPRSTRGAEKAKEGTGPDIAQVVTLIKDCDEAEAIEKKILDRSSQVDRTLLPLYIANKYIGNALALSSGDINKVTTELGVPVSTANASTTLSTTAARYVIGDSVRRRGQAVGYKLSRRGVHYMESVISGTPSEESK